MLYQGRTASDKLQRAEGSTNEVHSCTCKTKTTENIDCTNTLEGLLNQWLPGTRKRLGLTRRILLIGYITLWFRIPQARRI